LPPAAPYVAEPPRKAARDDKLIDRALN